MIMESEWLDKLEAALSARAPGKCRGLATLQAHRGKGLAPQTIFGGDGRWILDDEHSLSRYFRRTETRVETLWRRGYGSRPERRQTSSYVLVTLAQRRADRDEAGLVAAYLAALAPLDVEITVIETEPAAVWKREAPGVPFALPHEKMLVSVGLRRVQRLEPCPPPCP